MQTQAHSLTPPSNPLGQSLDALHSPRGLLPKCPSLLPGRSICIFVVVVVLCGLNCLHFCSWRNMLEDLWWSNICCSLSSRLADSIRCHHPWGSLQSVAMRGLHRCSDASHDYRLPPHPTHPLALQSRGGIHAWFFMALCSQTNLLGQGLPAPSKLWIFPLHWRNTLLGQLGFVNHGWVVPALHLSLWSVDTPFYPTSP